MTPCSKPAALEAVVWEAGLRGAGLTVTEDMPLQGVI